MKTLAANALPTLPAEVKHLVQEGVYALYALKQQTSSGGAYLLVTHRSEFYVISPDGSVVDADGASDVATFAIESAVTFRAELGSVQINHA